MQSPKICKLFSYYSINDKTYSSAHIWNSLPNKTVLLIKQDQLETLVRNFIYNSYYVLLCIGLIYLNVYYLTQQNFIKFFAVFCCKFIYF